MRNIVILLALATVVVMAMTGAAQAVLFTDFEDAAYVIGAPFVETEQQSWPAVDNWYSSDTIPYYEDTWVTGIGGGRVWGGNQGTSEPDHRPDEGHNAGDKSGRVTRGTGATRQFSDSTETITDFESIDMLVSLRAQPIWGDGPFDYKLKLRGNIGTTTYHDFYDLRNGVEAGAGITWMWVQNHDQPAGLSNDTQLFVYQDGGEGNRGWVDTGINGWGYNSNNVTDHIYTDIDTGDPLEDNINNQLCKLNIDIDWDNSQVTFSMTDMDDGIVGATQSSVPIDVNLEFQPPGEDPPAATYEEELIANGHFHLNGVNATSDVGYHTFDDIHVMGTAGLTGDFDEDGDVDGGDFLLWQTDMSVGDLADWTANFGNTSAAPIVAAVPEPSSVMLLLAGFLCWSWRRARRNPR